MTLPSGLEGSCNYCQIHKVDCVGHVQKHLGRTLHDLNVKRKLGDGKSLRGIRGRLTKEQASKELW